MLCEEQEKGIWAVQSLERSKFALRQLRPTTKSSCEGSCGKHKAG